MALTGTDRGVNGNATGATSLVITPGSNFAAGSMAVLCLAYDNTGSGGSDPYSSITDSLGHEWIPRQNILRDPGAAAAGAVLRIFTGLMRSNPLTTANTITVSFGSVSVVAKSYSLMEVTPGANMNVGYITGGVNNNGDTATANPTITTSSVPTGDMVIGAVAIESGTTQTGTGDGDTTNGAWSAIQYFEIGTTTSGMVVLSQRKVVTGAGTQTFNPTFGISGDVCIGWIQLREILAVTDGFFSFFR